MLFCCDAEELVEQSAMAFLREKFDDSLIKHIEEIGFINYVRGGGIYAGSDYKVGLIKADIYQPYGNVVIASLQTLRNKTHLLDPAEFDLIIIDECFPKGTLVDGKPIETIKVGDFVKSFNHGTDKIEYKKVKNLFKKEIKGDLVKITLSNGESFTCTDNHPVYTKEYGYVSARLVEKCFSKNEVHCLYLEKNLNNERANKVETIFLDFSERVSNVQKTICTASCGIKQRKGFLFNRMSLLQTRKLSNFLYKVRLLFELFHLKISPSKSERQNLLLKGLSQRGTKNSFKDSNNKLRYLPKTGRFDREKRIGKNVWEKTFYLFGRLQEKINFNWCKTGNKNEERKGVSSKKLYKNENQKPNVDGWGKRKNDCLHERENIFKQGREWGANETSVNATLGDWFGNGALYRNRASQRQISKPSALLQGRLSRSVSKTSNRSRRENPQVKEVEVFGQEKNGNFEFVRVASIEIYKRGSREFNEQMREENYVYNIEVEDNHNYFVENTLVHNCHIATATTYLRTIQHFTPRLLLGVSATPFRADNTDLGALFDEIVFDYDIATAIREGYLCEIDAVRVKTNINIDKVHTLGGEFNQKELADEVDWPARNFLVAESYLKYAKGRQMIGFTVDINHAIHLTEACIEKGINATAISSKELLTGDRSQKVKDFKAGKYDLVWNCGVLVKGFDFPNLGGVIHACPTKSLVKWKQATGRCLRLKDNDYVAKYGQQALLIDIVDTTSRHNLINAHELDKGLPPEEKVYISAVNREKLIESRRRRIEGKHDKDERIQLLPILTPKFKTTIKSVETVSEVERLHLKNFGYNVDEIVYTKENYREIVGSFPATSEQITELRKFGFDMSAPITRAQAGYTLWMYRNDKIKQAK